MSKSKFNGMNPNSLVDKYGSDALRVAIFFANPPDRDIDFSEEIILNAQKFLHRI
jgi:leucyl-tRNA synthetase